MDPDATWTQLLDAYVAGDWQQAEELASDLLQWLAKRGFPPKTLGRSDIGPLLNREVAMTVCSFCLSLAEQSGSDTS